MPMFEVIMSAYKTVKVEAVNDIEAMAKADQALKGEPLSWFPDFAEEIENA